MIVVESGGLLGEQLHRSFFEIVIGRQETEHFQGGFFGMDFFGFDRILHAVVEEFAQLGLVDERVGHVFAEIQAGDGGKIGFNGGDLVGDGGCGGKRILRRGDERYRGGQEKRA